MMQEHHRNAIGKQDMGSELTPQCIGGAKPTEIFFENLVLKCLVQ